MNGEESIKASESLESESSNLAFHEEAEKDLERIGNQKIGLTDCRSLIELSSYLFNSISNPQLNVIPFWMYSEDDFPSK